MPEDDSFEERLRQARERQGMNARPPSTGALPPGPWGIGFRAGVEVFSALVAGAGLGWLIDRWLGTWPWLFLLFFVFGGAAGVLNVYRLFYPRNAGK